MSSPYMAFPFSIDGSGRTATTAENQHIRDMIWQVLFTNPGERVNRPDFGCGLRRMVFAPNSIANASLLKVLINQSMDKWLSALITVTDVEAEANNETLNVSIA